MRRTFFILVALLTISAPSWAGFGSTASSYPEDFTMTSGIVSNELFSSFGVAGEGVVGIISNLSLSSQTGLAPTIYSGSIPGPDVKAPNIQNFLFDGFVAKSGDYVNSAVTITATITDESGIDQASSFVDIDGVNVVFSGFPAGSSYNVTTGALIYKPAFTTGPHTFALSVLDNAGNIASTDTLSLHVQGGDVVLQGVVVNYPNPFAPPAQSTKITYMLNKDSDVKIFIFNIVNQLVKKFEISSGAQGGRAGYNEVLWDGISDFAEVLPNDVYLCRIVINNKVIGKCKIAILK